ncbi:DUF4870 domain-containing protein [Nostocoides sp. HKS02]|uniref:DUF4870 domain-containing protein n=1 Tax=Nostocoides sp. HKS02 TaxID=1813880 RepID=UPI001E4F8C8C|nr:DUF4870 domain-containing protein [Tetrasphaera sp. HKS02]
MTDQPAPTEPPEGGQNYGSAPNYDSAPSANPMSQSDERLWSTLVHLSPFLAALVGLPFLGPLVIYLVLRDRGPFIRFHAAQALNFQLVLLIAYLVFGLLSIVLIGIPFLVATAVASVVFQIIAAVKANNGEWYRYPLTPDWVR